MEVILCAANAEELGVELAQLDIDVPERSAGRINRHAERFSIAHLLATLPTSRLGFPLSLAHSERPDFVMSVADSSIGIEHTEAVPENVARAQFLREKGAGPDVYFTPRATPDEPRKSAAELRAEIEANEPGDGWVGDSAEREWAVAMAHCVKKKILKATTEGFGRHTENWLLIYDNWPLPNVDLVVAVAFLRPLLGELNALTVFDSIFILDGSQMCELRDSPIIYSRTDPKARR